MILNASETCLERQSPFFLNHSMAILILLAVTASRTWDVLLFINHIFIFKFFSLYIKFKIYITTLKRGNKSFQSAVDLKYLGKT
jgi:hypothetical protein